MHDLVERAAQQPWSDGNVGMVGISYFAGTQMEAAVERPPHLKAIMPIVGTFDPIATRISACFSWHQFLQYGLFLVTIVAARGEVEER